MFYVFMLYVLILRSISISSSSSLVVLQKKIKKKLKKIEHLLCYLQSHLNFNEPQPTPLPITFDH
jgi:hypothetical protein